MSYFGELCSPEASPEAHMRLRNLYGAWSYTRGPSACWFVQSAGNAYDRHVWIEAEVLVMRWCSTCLLQAATSAVDSTTSRLSDGNRHHPTTTTTWRLCRHRSRDSTSARPRTTLLPVRDTGSDVTGVAAPLLWRHQTLGELLADDVTWPTDARSADAETDERWQRGWSGDWQLLFSRGRAATTAAATCTYLCHVV